MDESDLRGIDIQRLAIGESNSRKDIANERERKQQELIRKNNEELARAKEKRERDAAQKLADEEAKKQADEAKARQAQIVGGDLTPNDGDVAMDDSTSDDTTNTDMQDPYRLAPELRNTDITVNDVWRLYTEIEPRGNTPLLEELLLVHKDPEVFFKSYNQMISNLKDGSDGTTFVARKGEKSYILAIGATKGMIVPRSKR